MGAENGATDAMTAYRPPAGGLAAGLFCAAFYEGLGIWGAVGALRNDDGSFPHPVGFAIFFVTASSAMAAYMVFIGIRLYTERLHLGVESCELQRWRRRRTVSWAHVTHARWRTRPNMGSIVLRAPGVRFAIDFANYRPPGRKDLIATLRDRLPSHVQEGWPAFEHRYFPDEAEKKRRLERFERPLPRWAEALLVAVMIGLAAALVWSLAYGYGSER